jgi:hypothetical protein
MHRATILLLLPLLAAAQTYKVPFACAEEDILAAGLVCTEAEPCAIYLELNSIATAGRKIFLAGDIHADSGTISSVLLMSEDAGATWKEPSPRIRGAALDQLQIYDLEHGWAAGETQYPLSRDPFFLITSDGGQTWRNQPVYEDGGPGSIQQFWFDSAKHGELVVDAGRKKAGSRYVTLESETGAENWMARASTPQSPTLKRAPKTDESDFRIAAKDKRYEIEKRVGDKWERIASLAIEIAACKLKPIEAKEPPAVTEVQPKDPDAPKPAATAVKKKGPVD